MTALNTKTRSAYIDNLKALLIFLVVVGHLAETSLSAESDSATQMILNAGLGYPDGSVNEAAVSVLMGQAGHLCKCVFSFLYAFHMPLFLFLSGCVSKNIVKSKEQTISKSIFYLILYFLLKLICTGIRFGFGEDISLSVFSESSVPWYAFALSIFYLISYLTKDIKKSILLIFSIILGIFSGYDDSIGDFLVLSRTIVFYPFFLMGLMCNIENIRMSLQKTPIRIISFIFLVLFGCICWFNTDLIYVLRPLFTGRNAYDTLDELTLYGGLLRLLHYGICLIISISILSLMPDRKIWFSKLGQRTLPVYFFHRPVIYIMTGGGVYTALITKFGAGNIVTSLIWIAFAVHITILFSLKIFSYPFEWLNKLCKPQCTGNFSHS